jgi:hypothetical protein
MKRENHIDTVRQHILDQMTALRTAKPENIKQELDRAKGLSELAQVAVNTAKVEVDYLVATKQPNSRFLEAPVEVTSDSSTSGVPVPPAAEGVTSLAEWPGPRRVHKLEG